MDTNSFSIREREIFNILKQIKDYDFVMIGGYAVNAYTLPRFSVDCDIVIKDSNELSKIAKILVNFGYKKNNPKGEFAYSGKFCRYEKILSKDFSVSIDILIGDVSDRMTGIIFDAEWIFKHSSKNRLNGKTIIEELQLKIIDIDALIVMKTISCRATDIRDIFMMLPNAKDIEWIKKEISSRYDFNSRIKKILEKINSKQFKDGLSGVYGQIDNNLFDKHKKTVERLQELGKIQD
jgi:DNA relaxase NicK